MKNKITYTHIPLTSEEIRAGEERARKITAEREAAEARRWTERQELLKPDFDAIFSDSGISPNNVQEARPVQTKSVETREKAVYFWLYAFGIILIAACCLRVISSL